LEEIGNRTYASPEPLSLKELEGKLKGMKATFNAKPHVTHARRLLRAQPLLVGGFSLSMDISKNRYAFCVAITKDPLAARRLIWSPYFSNSRSPIVIGCVKRLFFKIDKDVYIRNVAVNNEGSWRNCNILKTHIADDITHAVRLYAPSGEVSATYALLDLFNNQLAFRAVGSLIEPQREEREENLIVLGSGIEEPHYGPKPLKEFFCRNFHNGVDDLKSSKRFVDKLTDDENLRVYVILQRWQETRDSVVTAVYGSHAAAVEAVVKKLVVESSAQELIEEFPRIENWLRKRVKLECLFAVDLVRNGDYFRAQNTSILVPDQKKLKSLKKSRGAQRSFKKGA
jgi:hypothetical protein